MFKELLNRFKNESPSGTFEDFPELPTPGDRAPDFYLPAISRNGRGAEAKGISLDDLQGQPAVLVFYPADNSSVCSSQLALYNEALSLVEKHDAQLVAVSVDDLQTHQDFSERLKLDFPLLSDEDPKGGVARDYGVFDDKDGVSERALFVLDAGGRVHWRTVLPRKVNPGMDGILSALESLAAGD
jgi:peroxiredoxin